MYRRSHTHSSTKYAYEPTPIKDANPIEFEISIEGVAQFPCLKIEEVGPMGFGIAERTITYIPTPFEALHIIEYTLPSSLVHSFGLLKQGKKKSKNV